VNGAAATSVADLGALAASTGPAYLVEPATRSVWVHAPSAAGAVTIAVTAP
jgi:hypothetical protein